MLEKTAISVSQTVDKRENANNNEIIISVFPSDFSKFAKNCVFQTILCMNTQENAKLWQVFFIFSAAKTS